MEFGIEKIEEIICFFEKKFEAGQPVFQEGENIEAKLKEFAIFHQQVHQIMDSTNEKDDDEEVNKICRLDLRVVNVTGRILRLLNQSKRPLIVDFLELVEETMLSHEPLNKLIRSASADLAFREWYK